MAQELDPATNLPQQEETESGPLKPNGKPSAKQRLQAARKNQQLRGSQPTTVGGTFGDYGGALVTPEKNFNEIRAQGQSGFDLFTNSLAQTAGTVAGMTVESVGFLGDIPQAVNNMVTGSEMEFERNALADFGKYIQDKTRETFPIYQTEQAKRGGLSRFADGTYWATHIPSIASTVGLMGVGFAGGAGAGALARVLGAGRTGQQIAATMGSALASRHSENMMLGYESYEKIYQRALENGKSEAEAKQVAVEQAANTYRMGYGNLWMDMAQWGGILRGVNFPNRAIKGSIAEIGEQSGDDVLRAMSKELKRNPNLTVKQAAKKGGYSWKEYLAQSGLEGYEEFNQEFIKRLNEHNADVALGLTDASEKGFAEAYLGGMMGEHLQDPKAWDSAIMGALGGAVFQGLGALGAREWNRNLEAENARQLKSAQEKAQYIKDTLNNINIALTKGDEVTAEKHRDDLIFNLAINGLNNNQGGFKGGAVEGNLENTLEMFRAVDSMNDEQLETLGLDPETAREEARNTAGEIEQIGNLVSSYYNNVTGTGRDAELAVMMANHEYKNRKNRKHQSDIEGQIEELYTQDDFVSGAMESLSPDQQELVRLKKQLDAKKKILKDIKNDQGRETFGLAPFRGKILKKARNKSIAQLEQEIQETAQQLSDLAPKNQRDKLGIKEFELEDVAETADIPLNKDTVDSALNVSENIAGEDTKLEELYNNLEETKVEVVEGQEQLSQLHQPGVQKDFVDALSQTGEQLRQQAYRTLFRRQFDSGSYINKDGNIFKIEYGEERDDITLTPVSKDLMPTGEGQSFNPDEIEEYLNVTEVDPERYLEQYEVDALRDEFNQAIDNNNFEEAFNIINDELYRSNYTETASRAMETFNERIVEKIENEDSVQSLFDLNDRLVDSLPDERLPLFQTTIRRRLTELGEQYEQEIDAIDKAISKKENQFNKKLDEIQDLESQIEDVKADLDNFTEDILSDLQEEGVQNIDRRTKPAQKIEAMEESVAQTVQDLKQEQRILTNQASELESDIKRLKKLRENLDQTEMPSVILNAELKQTFEVIESIRTKLMLRADITEEEAETLLDRYKEAQEEINTAISAIENFRDYLGDIFGAGEVIGIASNLAYQDLRDRGVLSGNESLFDGVSQQIFNTYRIQFNKHLTDQLKSKERPLTERERRFIEENRLSAKDAGEMGVNFWAEVNKDFPTNSQLFQAEDIQFINEAVDNLELLSEFWRDAQIYDGLLKLMSKEINRRKASVEPQGQRKSKDEDLDIKQWDAPQRTIFTAFTRPAGSTGDNQNPSPVASQRRYGRFVNKTNVEDDQYYIRVMRPPEGFVDEARLKEFGYDPEEVLVGIVTDEQGNYLNEEGEIVNELDPDTIVYTSMPLPTYDTITSGVGRTFTPDSYYLAKTYPDLKNEEARLEAYERDKEKELEKYKDLRQEWLDEIGENGFAEVGVIGKSLGVSDKVPNHGQYDQGATPTPLGDVFDNPNDLEFTVNTDNFRDHYGEVVSLSKGFVTLRNPETGNYFEGAVRRLQDNEVRTLIELLRTHVRQSEIKEDFIDTSNANQIEGIDKSIFEIFKDYTFSFDQEAKAPIDFERVNKDKYPGGRILIKGQAFEIFANNPEGEGKINQVNPDLVDALKEYLSDKFVQVSSSKTKNNESFTQVIFEDGEFKQRSYDSYKQYLIENNVVGTWRKPKQSMVVETQEGTLEEEEGYTLFNQQLIYDVPEIGTETNTKSLPSLDSLPEGISYVTPITDGINGIWKIKAETSEGQRYYSSEGLVNRESLSQEEQQKLDKRSEEDVLSGVEAGKFEFTEFEEVQEETETTQEEPSVEQIKQLSQPRKEATENKRKNLKDRLDAQKGKEKKEKKSSRIVDRLKKHKVSNGKTVTEQEIEGVAEKLQQATGIPVNILTTGQAIDFMENLRFQGYHNQDYAKNPDSLPYGMYHNSKAYIFGKERITLETAFHEVAHPIIDQIIDTNPYLFEQLKTDLANSDEGQKIIDHVLRNYPNIFEDGDLTTRGWAEVIVTAIGRAAESKQLQQDKNIDSFLTRIFKAIKEFFDNLFTRPVNTRDLGLDTTVGDLATMLVEGTAIDIDTVQATEYSRKDNINTVRTESRMTLPGESVKFTQDSLNITNYWFFQLLFDEYQDQMHTLFTQEGNKGLKDQIMNDIRDEFIDTAELFLDPEIAEGIDFTAEQLNEEAEKYIRVIEKWDDLQRLYTQHLQKFNLEAVTEEDLETELTDDTNKLWQDDHLIFSAKQNATSLVRFLVGSLTSRKTNDTFPTNPQTVEFGETFNILANKLSGTTTLEEKRSIIERLQDQDGFPELYQRLFRKPVEQMDESDINTATALLQFNETFSKHFNNYILIIKDAVESFKAIDATINSGKRVILAEWQANTYDRAEIYNIEEGQLKYDPEYFKEKFPDKVIDTEQGKKTIPYRIVQDMNLTEQQERWVNQQKANKRSKYRNHYKAMNFLEELGIEFSAEAYHEPAGEEFNKRAQYILNQIKSGVTSDIFDANSEVSQDMDVIAQHEIDNSVDRVENQHQNIDGETVYNVVLNHYVSMIEDKINNVDDLASLQDELPHLFATEYTRSSLLLNRKGAGGRIYNNLFAEDGTKAEYDDKGTKRRKELTVDITEGMRNNQEAKSFNDMTYTDKIHLAVNSLVKDRYSLFRAGDKKLERYIPLEFFTATEIRDENQHVGVFIDYLVDEIKFIREAVDYPTEYSGLNRLVKRDDEGNININYEYSILPNFFAQNKELKGIIDEVINNGNVSRLREANTRRKLQTSLNNYFAEKVDETRELLEEHMVITKEGEIYKNNGLMGLTDNEGKGYNETQVNRILWETLVNRSIANVEQTKLFTAHPAFYSKSDMEGSLDNFFHRMSGAAGTKKISSTGNEENKLIEKFFPSDHRLYKYVDENGVLQTTKEYSQGVRPIIRSAVFKDPDVTSRYMETIKSHITDNEQLKVYKSMEESDAMGLVSLDTYRDMKIRAGEWGEALERLYAWENKEPWEDEVAHYNWATGEIETITEYDLINNDGSQTVFTMLKPQYFGPMAEQGFIPGMYKLAVMPVLPSITRETNEEGEVKYPAMNDLKNYMDNNDVGLVTFEAANKVGTKNPGQELYTDGNPDFSTVDTQDTWYDYWGLQLQTGNKIKDEVILGSQFMKQIISGIYSGGSAEEGSSKHLGELADKMGKIHSGLIETGKEQLRQELDLTQKDNGEYTTESVENLITFLRDEAIKREANHNVLDSLEYLKDYINGNMGLDVMSNRDKIENILAAMADKRVISQNVHGGAKVQAASTFFEKKGRVKAGNKWLSQEDLKFYEDGTMEVYMPHYFKEYFGEVPGDIDPELLEAVGFRIPTSGRNVIENIKIKDFLPKGFGETIVLPSEIVAKAGSDFDVDKLNILLPNYRVVDGDVKYIRYLDSIEEANKLIQDISKDLSEKTGRKPKKERVREELRNRGYETLADNLGKKEMSILDMNSSEGLQNGLIDVSKEIMTDSNVQKDKFTPIGVDILENQKERIDKLRNVEETDPSYHKMLFDFNYGQRITQRNIESIAGTGLAALHTSDHVHATRYNYKMLDGRSIALPHNEEGDQVSLGGKYSADGKNEIGNLLNQITNMFIDGVKNPLSFGLNLNLETGSTALYLTRAGVPPKVLFSFLNQPAIRDYVHFNGIDESLPNQEGDILGREGVSNKLSAKYGSTPYKGNITYTELNRYLDPKNQKGSEFKKFQKRILDEYKKYEQSAQLLSEYVNATRVDTEAMGKNTSQLDLMLRSLDKIADRDIKIENTDKLLREEDNGFLAPHYKALQDFRLMFEPFFVHMKDENAYDMYQSLVGFVDKKAISMEDKVRILDKFKNDYITHRVLNSETSINGTQVQFVGSDLSLFEGENSLPKRIMRYKKKGTDNLLLKSLLPIIGRTEVNGRMIDNLKLMDQKLDTFEQNSLIESWRELFFENEPLARDLVKFTFIQNGLQLSPMTFTKYVPAEVYMEVLDGAFDTNENVESVHFLEKFFENNYNDENLIPTKWGTKTPKSSIWKKYSYKPGYNKNNAAEARAKGINPYEATPNIFIDEGGVSVGDYNLFIGTRKLNVEAVKDFRNNRALLSYGIRSQKSTETEQPPPSLTEEEIKAQMRIDNRHPKESINKNNNCRGKS